MYEMDFSEYFMKISALVVQVPRQRRRAVELDGGDDAEPDGDRLRLAIDRVIDFEILFVLARRLPCLALGEGPEEGEERARDPGQVQLLSTEGA